MNRPYIKPKAIDWRELMRELRESGLATTQIVERVGGTPCGLRALGGARDHHRTTTQPLYSLGAALVALHDQRCSQ